MQSPSRRVLFAVAFAFSIVNPLPRFESSVHGQTNPTIVLYAAKGIVTGGRWSVAADSQAAGGSAATNPNIGDSKILSALASPASYVEATFTAPANVRYHVWLRMKAQNNSWSNDSVYVQFSDSLSSSGAAYRIGTTSGMAVVLEEAVNAGLSGWGWADNSYGGLGANVTFASSGTHQVRIQQREDGVALDQIVLSPSTYLTKPPGATKNDQTILPANDGSGTPPPPPPPPPPGGSFKVATWNIRSGEGRCGITGACPFVDSTLNCTDASQPLNAWGHDMPQQELLALAADPSAIAIGLQEAWVCGSPSSVNGVLHWAYASPTYNGTGMVARYGIRGALETKLVSAPGDEGA